MLSAPSARVVGALVWRLHIARAGPLPEGPKVIAANHFSHLDIPVVAAAVRRPVRFLAVDELYGQNLFLESVLAGYGAIPLSRSRVPLGAIRVALRHLEDGGSVGLFPEGRRVRFFGESPIRRGAAWLSLRTGAPLIPVAVAGTDRVFGVDQTRPGVGRIEAWVGAPLDADAYLQNEDPIGALTGAWQNWVAAKLGVPRTP
jgi:1-acyl-sn-glycerol-3-phosphate acyltransferase